MDAAFVSKTLSSWRPYVLLMLRELGHDITPYRAAWARANLLAKASVAVERGGMALEPSGQLVPHVARFGLQLWHVCAWLGCELQLWYVCAWPAATAATVPRPSDICSSASVGNLDAGAVHLRVLGESLDLARERHQDVSA